MTSIAFAKTTFAPGVLSRAVALSAAIAAAGFLSACQDEGGLRGGRAYKPIPAETVALMQQKGMTKHSPILFRAFKKEAELEIWKMKADGEYALLKTYPMCRWSGQLGPKVREGDRQVPEGFYAITPNKMNPNSNYYLSFDVGYPNAYDRAHNRTGSLIMVHGACSSAGCFSMTDEQIAEIYAIAREAFGGGQPAIQMQSMPFRMNAENLAKHRFDPHMKFWRQIKEGADHFEITKREPQVAVCGGRYVFNAKPKNASDRFDSRAACPPVQQEESLVAATTERNRREQQQVARLVSEGTRAVKVVYADGGQHSVFESVTRVSRPEALAKAPVEIPIDEKGRVVKTPVHVASAKPDNPAAAPAAAASVPSQRPAATAVASRPATAPAAAGQTTVVPQESATAPAAGVPAAASAFAPQPPAASSASASEPFYRRWLGGGSGQSSEAPAAVPPPAQEPPAAQAPPAAPAPPRRAESDGARKPPPSPAPKRDKQAGALPEAIRGSAPALPPGLMAYSRGW